MKAELLRSLSNIINHSKLHSVSDWYEYIRISITCLVYALIGKYNVTFVDMKLSPCVREKLEANGYTVIKKNPRIINISWDK